MIPRSTRVGLTALVVGVLLSVCTSCSGDDDDDDGDGGAATEAEQVCTDWDQLRGAVTELTDLDVAAEGTNALEPVLQDLTDATSQLRASAGEAIDDEVDALGTAVDELGTAVDELPPGDDDDPAGTGLVAVGEAIQGVSTAAQDLGDEIQPDCDA